MFEHRKQPLLSSQAFSCPSANLPACSYCHNHKFPYVGCIWLSLPRRYGMDRCIGQCLHASGWYGTRECTPYRWRKAVCLFLCSLFWNYLPGSCRCDLCSPLSPLSPSLPLGDGGILKGTRPSNYYRFGNLIS